MPFYLGLMENNFSCDVFVMMDLKKRVMLDLGKEVRPDACSVEGREKEDNLGRKLEEKGWSKQVLT